MVNVISDFLVCGTIKNFNTEKIIKIRQPIKTIKNPVYCSEPLLVTDLDNIKIPILYFCSKCKQYYKKENARIKGKCVICKRIFDDPFNPRANKRCKYCYCRG